MALGDEADRILRQQDEMARQAEAERLRRYAEKLPHILALCMEFAEAAQKIGMPCQRIAISGKWRSSDVWMVWDENFGHGGDGVGSSPGIAIARDGTPYMIADRKLRPVIPGDLNEYDPGRSLRFLTRDLLVRKIVTFKRDQEWRRRQSS